MVEYSNDEVMFVLRRFSYKVFIKDRHNKVSFSKVLFYLLKLLRCFYIKSPLDLVHDSSK